MNKNIDLLLSDNYTKDVLSILDTMNKDNYVDLVNTQILALHQYINSLSLSSVKNNKSNLRYIEDLLFKIKWLILKTKVPGYVCIEQVINNFMNKIQVRISQIN